MNKIISLFRRNYDGDRLVTNEVVTGAEWVVSGEGVATRKWDGTCCRIKNRKLYKRYSAKKGRILPVGFESSQDPDPVTGHWFGWLPVGNGPEDRWFREVALDGLSDGTYELIGPKVQGNPEGVSSHQLVRHGEEKVEAPRSFEALKTWFATQNIEGVVWHHPDGRMVKIKKRDFGLKRS